ncbi:MAG: hypothetical protein GY799_12280 [Desulfobulbaceae bacterium]|nr:hypothetical protein [Desulfobulbaceae bacterium]
MEDRIVDGKLNIDVIDPKTGYTQTTVILTPEHTEEVGKLFVAEHLKKQKKRKNEQLEKFEAAMVSVSEKIGKTIDVMKRVPMPPMEDGGYVVTCTGTKDFKSLFTTEEALRIRKDLPKMAELGISGAEAGVNFAKNIEAFIRGQEAYKAIEEDMRNLAGTFEIAEKLCPKETKEVQEAMRTAFVRGQEACKAIEDDLPIYELLPSLYEATKGLSQCQIQEEFGRIKAKQISLYSEFKAKLASL